MSLLTILSFLSGCATLDERRQSATVKQAIAQAPTVLPDLPAKCREKMRRVSPQEGQQWFAVQARWLTAADEQDARTAFCSKYYDDVKTRFGAR